MSKNLGGIRPPDPPLDPPLLWSVTIGGVKDTRTQGSRLRPMTQKNLRPRPRTALPRTEPFEAKDRNARGQEPRTQAQVFSKKKSLHKTFSGDLQTKTKKVFDKIFRTISKRRKQKRSSQIFREISGVFQQNFRDSKK